jgi:hypothetical protein
MPRLTKAMTATFAALNTSCVEATQYARDVVVPRLVECGAAEIGRALTVRLDAVRDASTRLNELLVSSAKRK